MRRLRFCFSLSDNNAGCSKSVTERKREGESNRKGRSEIELVLAVICDMSLHEAINKIEICRSRQQKNV